MDKKELIKDLYEKYSFVEEDESKFTEIALFNIKKGDNEEAKAKKNVVKYLVEELKHGKFLNLFKKSVDKRGLDYTFGLFNTVLSNAKIEFSEEMIEALGETKEYAEYYKGLSEKEEEILNELLSEVVDYFDSMNGKDDLEIEGINIDEMIASDNSERRSMQVSKEQLHDYLAYISQFDVFTREEEIAAFTKWKQTNDPADRDYFIEHNLRLAAKQAFREHNSEDKLEIIDLIQEGNIGLMKALNKFKLDRGCKFSTYAIWWIRQSIKRAKLDQGNTIRIPVHVGEDLETLRKFIRNFRLENYREPQDEEICEGLDWSMDRLKDLKDAELIKKPSSLDKAIECDDSRRGDESVFGEFLTDENKISVEDEALNSVMNEELINLMRECLDDRSFKVICLRYGIAVGDEFNPEGRRYTLEEIGKGYGLTRERIRQIQAKSLKKLRNGARRKNIKKEDVVD